MKPRSSKISTTFSTLSEAMIVQRNLRNDPTYKELKKFFFRDIEVGEVIFNEEPIVFCLNQVKF